MFGPLLFSALLLVNAASAAPDPCKGVKFEADKFTQKDTSKQLLWAYMATTFGTYKDGVVELSVDLGLTGLHQQTLPAGHKVLFLLGDGKIVELATSAEAPAVPTTEWGSAGTKWQFRFPLDKATAAMFGAEEVEALRTTMHTGEETRSNISYAKQFRKAMACYASKMPG